LFMAVLKIVFYDNMCTLYSLEVAWPTMGYSPKCRQFIEY